MTWKLYASVTESAGTGTEQPSDHTVWTRGWRTPLRISRETSSA